MFTPRRLVTITIFLSVFLITAIYSVTTATAGGGELNPKDHPPGTRVIVKETHGENERRVTYEEITVLSWSKNKRLVKIKREAKDISEWVWPASIDIEDLPSSSSLLDNCEISTDEIVCTLTGQT